MSLDFCKDCDHVVEAAVLRTECPGCGMEIKVCRHCEGTYVVGVACEPEENPNDEAYE